MRGHRLFQAGGPLRMGVDLAAARRSSEFTRFDGYLGVDPGLTGHLLDRPVSASALQKWATCPRAFMFEQLLGVSELEEPDVVLRMSPLERGLLMHDAVDAFLAPMIEKKRAPGPNHAYTNADRARLAEAVEAKLAASTEAGLSGRALFVEIDHRRIRRDMAEFCDRDAQRRPGGEAVASEYGFGIPARNGEPAAPAVRYRLPDGRELTFRGAIDRVDRAAEGLVVTDYKAGRYDFYSDSVIKENPTNFGKQLQPAIYSIVAAERFGPDDDPEPRWEEAVAQAGYWFFTSRPGGWRHVDMQPDATVRAGVDEVLSKIATGISKGVFPGRSDETMSVLYGHWCACCIPDGLGTWEFHQRWERKSATRKMAPYVDLVEPAGA
ncbi:MAG TPA: hypothetical protein DEP69_02090 [Acidimicrobiaceae bacterium]|nr:hypothetical protein [Acidimicrobiaceae bacterium]